MECGSNSSDDAYRKVGDKRKLLVMTVIPLNGEPYKREIKSQNDGRFRRLFTGNPELWKPIFGEFVESGEEPDFGVFRAEVTVKAKTIFPHAEKD